MTFFMWKISTVSASQNAIESGKIVHGAGIVWKSTINPDGKDV